MMGKWTRRWSKGNYEQNAMKKNFNLKKSSTGDPETGEQLLDTPATLERCLDSSDALRTFPEEQLGSGLWLNSDIPRMAAIDTESC